MSTPSLGRHQIRIKALQAIFQMKFNEELDRDDAIEAALLSELEDDETELPDAPYLSEIVHGVLDNEEAINDAIRPYLKNWTLERLPKTDSIILQIAVYELFFAKNEEIPQRVALNEAIELAKDFSDEKSRKFINGVLSNMVKE